jgi:UDP-glucose 4-epimerase/UDP-glucuronate decarboxylase
VAPCPRGHVERGKALFGSTSETYAGLARALKIPYPTPEDVPLGLADVKNPRWSYGGSKLVGELFFLNYGRMHGKRTVVARFTNVYGPRMGHDHVIPEFLDRILAKQDPFRIVGAEPTRTFCYVEDAVRATRLVMGSAATDHDVVNVGSDQGELTMRSLAETMFRLFGHHPRLDLQPAPKGSVPRRCPDISKLRKLGYEPRVGLEEGLQRTHAWYAAERQGSAT